MGLLSKLVFVCVNRTHDLSPVQLRRRKLINNLEEQVALAHSILNGEKLRVIKRRWQLTDAGGKELVEVEKRVRPWWRIADNGEIILTVRWGSKILEFQRGKAGIVVAGLEEVISTLKLLIKATEAGELDDIISSRNNTSHVAKKAGLLSRT